MRRYARWRDMMEMMLPPLPWDRARRRDRCGPRVVLLHGLWRGRRAMEPLARALDREGFSTLNIAYPSTRLPIPALVETVRNEVAKVSNDQPVHFITHSLGGIIVRALMAEPAPWKFGRVIMLVPPNCGSEIVDWSARHRLLHRLLGPAGRALGTHGFPGSLPPLPPGAETAVIMGSRPTIPFFQSMLAAPNDGIVSAPRGRIDGLRCFTVIDADHTFIQVHPDAIRLCIEFLHSGTWSLPESP